MITLKQGEDLALELLVFNRNNQKVDLTTASKIRVGLYVKGVLVNKYLDSTREAAIPGYGSAIVSTLDNSAVTVLVTREQSALFPVGVLTARVLAEYPDVTLSGVAEEYEVNVGQVQVGYLKDENLNL